MKDLRKKSNASMEAKVKANGGTLKSKAHPDEAEDKAMVKKMVKPSALAERKKGGSVKNARSKTQINVVVAPRGKDRPVPVPIPVREGAAGPAAVAPSRPLVRPAAPQGDAIPLKKGGKAKRADGGRVGKFDAGAGSGEGRLEKTAHQKRRG